VAARLKAGSYDAQSETMARRRRLLPVATRLEAGNYGAQAETMARDCTAEGLKL